MKRDNILNENGNEKNKSAFQHVFLLSHMRANTSLMSHILGSHPQVHGYYEMHSSYLTQKDLLTQEALLVEDDSIDNKQYVFDKILHNKYELRLGQLNSELTSNQDPTTISLLISIRAPEQSIKSIINLFQNKKNHHPYAEPKEATQYYIERIKELARFCEQYKSSYYYYDADTIRKNPETSLPKIQQWLSLETPLKQEYQVFSLTGKLRMGDSSDNMKKGSIVKQQTNYEAITIPSDLLQEAITETIKCRQLIIDNAIESLIYDQFGNLG